MRRIARIFPRKTKATPEDSLAFVGMPKIEQLEGADEVHISVAFTYDKPKAENMAAALIKRGFSVTVGGAAYDDAGGEFTPGLYVKKGIVMTSRGCDNNCWFCLVPRREGKIRELKINNGFNITDSNLLQCSDEHIRAVFDMLKRQPERPVFTGGLEARRLKSWHVELLRESRTKRLYCAYDTPDDYDALVQAGKLLRDGGITKASHIAKAYVLTGYPGDTFEKAEKRLRDTWEAGFFPFSMLYRAEKGETNKEWRKFTRLWARPQITYKLLKEGNNA
jgi:hypothetical protein